MHARRRQVILEITSIKESPAEGRFFRDQRGFASRIFPENTERDLT